MADTDTVPEMTEHQASLLSAPDRFWVAFGVGDLLMRKSSPGNVSALVDWIGRVGFDEAVKHLTTRFGEERAKKIAGKLKKMADEREKLAAEHAYGKSGLFLSLRNLVAHRPAAAPRTIARRIPMRPVASRLLRFTTKERS